MLPSRRQYEKWSLPSKWSFWAAVIGIPLGIISLLLALLPLRNDDPEVVERNRMLLQSAQELRFNDAWLSQLTIASSRRSGELPIGSLKTDGLLRLVENHHDWIVQDAYGEEKYIYQLILELRDVGLRLGSPTSGLQLEKSLGTSDYTLNDINFLNNFIFWYLRPRIEEDLTREQIYSLGWNGLPRGQFQAPGGGQPRMKRFLDDGEPITEYSTYLGLID